MDCNSLRLNFPQFSVFLFLSKVGVVRQVESAALKAAGLTESGKKSGTFKRELVAVFTQVEIVDVRVSGRHAHLGHLGRFDKLQASSFRRCLVSRGILRRRACADGLCTHRTRSHVFVPRRLAKRVVFFDQYITYFHDVATLKC